MLEALIVYMVTIFLLFFILALFCVFYHLWNMQIVTNEAAARVAQTYKYVETADVDTGYVTINQISDLGRYRYLFGSQKKMEQESEKKLTNYINRRLNRASFVNRMKEPQIRVVVQKDSLASRHVEVTTVEEFEVPFGEALSYFGFNDTIHYECTGYANCVDLIDYVNTVDYAERQTSLKQFNSSTIEMVNAVLKFFSHIADKMQ